jgi:purine-binding chemotaxis protein CheW
MYQLVVWTLDAQRYALPLASVERVFRAVAITPLPDAPAIVRGIINVQGRLIPVVSVRSRFQLPERNIELSDQLILAHTARRPIAFFADTVSGEVDYPDEAVITADAVVTETGYIAGVVKLADGLVLVHDLDRFLSIDEERALDRVLDHVAN